MTLIDADLLIHSKLSADDFSLIYWEVSAADRAPGIIVIYFYTSLIIRRIYTSKS